MSLFHFILVEHIGKKTDIGQAFRHLRKVSPACSRGSPITFSSFGHHEVTAGSGLSLDCTTSSMTESFSKMVASEFVLFSGAENVTSTSSSGETGSPRGAVTSEKVFQVCPVKGPEILRGPPLLCTMLLCWRSVIGWFWQNTHSSHSPSQTSSEPDVSE